MIHPTFPIIFPRKEKPPPHIHNNTSQCFAQKTFFGNNWPEAALMCGWRDVKIQELSCSGIREAIDYLRRLTPTKWIYQRRSLMSHNASWKASIKSLKVSFRPTTVRTSTGKPTSRGEPSLGLALKDELSRSCQLPDKRKKKQRDAKMAAWSRMRRAVECKLRIGQSSGTKRLSRGGRYKWQKPVSISRPPVPETDSCQARAGSQRLRSRGVNPRAVWDPLAVMGTLRFLIETRQGRELWVTWGLLD